MAVKELFLAALCCVLLSQCHGLNILGVFMIPAQSHYFVGSSLMKGLADAGHNVTFITPIAAKKTPNYEEVVLSGAFELLQHGMPNFFEMGAQSVNEEIAHVQFLGLMLSNFTFQHPNVQTLLNSGRTYDVVVLELFVSEALLGLKRHFKANSLVAVSTFGASVWTDNLVGNPSPSSFIPHPFLDFTERMTFLERTDNFLVSAYEKMQMQYSYYPRQEAILRRYLPAIQTPFKQILKNDVNLVLLNSHFSLNYPRPYMPNIIEVGGMNINRNTQPLPEDLQTILDNSTQGVVYFSMGSNIQCVEMPLEKRQALLAAFKKLPYRVLWKWEADELPGKSDNIVTRKWFPQDAVLAHPNVKLFITHGGLLSTTESIYFGKPIVGIPIFGDQQLNMKRAALSGYGVALDFRANFTDASLSWAINEVLGSKV